MTKILLDIDGVLNPLGDLSQHALGKTFLPYHRQWINWRLSLVYHEPMIEELLQSNAEIIWASSWDQDSNHVCRFMGFNEFDFLPLSKTQDAHHSWKFESIREYVLSLKDEKVVWIDDEITSADIRWSEGKENVFFLKTNPDVGYLESEHQQVMRFVISASE